MTLPDIHPDGTSCADVNDPAARTADALLATQKAEELTAVGVLASNFAEMGAVMFLTPLMVGGA
jgi:hypothetical protein